ncbi:ECF transporter S component [Propionibacteriaceae bacterium Y1685]|uniref:ECF transporter S component n=1 Tax=Microlunatus sp. Y1700 TaxID=3418487 RepID=UPI003B793E07
MSTTVRTRAQQGQQSTRATGPLMRWRTVDLITAVMIGVAFGVAFIGWGQVYNLTGPLFAALPPLSGVLGGFWWLPAVVAALVIRRPGAALLAEIVAASVEPLLGGQWGLTTLGSGVLQGLGVELGFLIFAYGVFGVAPAMIGGALAGLLETPYEWLLYYREWAIGYAGVYAVTMIISGALVGGLLAVGLVRALAATGVLAPFPPGREHAEARTR